MSLKDRIGDDIKTAMKARDKIRLETARGIKKLILEKESELRAKGREELNEGEEIAILSQLAKQRRDAIAQFSAGGREDLAEKETQELAVIETYLPAQLSDAEIEAEVDAAIAAAGVTDAKQMGKVMGPLMQKLKGKADGQKVKALVEAKLGS